jgi:hypothetical protein
MGKNIGICSVAFILLFLLPGFSSAQLILKNTCSGSTEPVLFTDAVNYFKIENWPGKSLMNIDCNSCTIEFQDAGGIFKLTPSSNKEDTLSVYRDNKLVQEFILKHEKAPELTAHFSKGSNKTISRTALSNDTEVILKSGKPGCRSVYTVSEFDLLLPSERIHCKGNKLSPQAISKLQSLKPGMQFNIENALYSDGKSQLKSATATYYLKD